MIVVPEELAYTVARSIKDAKAAGMSYHDWLWQHAPDTSDDYSTIWAAIK